MLNNAGKLSSAGKLRGIPCATLTCLEVQIAKLEDKPENIHSDPVMIQGHTEKLNSQDSTFRRHHFAIIDQIDEDQEMLEQEQAVLNDHEGKVINMMDRLIQLGRIQM